VCFIPSAVIHDLVSLQVSDFGLSRMIEDQLSATMTVCGTPCWTAPEVLRNQKYSVKADVYSFGIVMWEVSTRMDPYQGVAPFQVVVQVATSHLRPGIPPYCPQPWIDLMIQCWSEVPEDRPTFGEIVERLQSMEVSGVPTDFSLSPQPSPASTPAYGSSVSSELPPVQALSGSFLAGVSSGAASATAASYGSIQN
jgi:serine/threonine protein kinase